MDDDDIQLSDLTCPKCRQTAYMRYCDCDEGLSHHDCGDDCCVCSDPEPNVRCDLCHGHGRQEWCRNCGWDLILGRYINGRNEAAT